MLLGIIGNIAAGTVTVSGKWQIVVWTGTALLAAGVVLGEAMAQPGAADGPERSLRDAVLAHCLAELEFRGVTDPYPLPVSWRTAPADLLDHPDAQPVVAEAGQDQVAQTYAAIASGRLVVLGDAGAGKSVLALILALQLAETGPVIPVVLDLRRYHPEDPFNDWVLRMIESTYAQAPESIVPLIQGRQLVLVLDGLDEVDHGWQGKLLRALNASLFPLVVTCRVDDYRRLAHTHGVLRSAAGVVLQPLTEVQVIHYLRRSAPPAATKWDDLFAAVKSSGPEARRRIFDSLGNPLILSLARYVYGHHRRPDPVEMMDDRRFPDAAAIEQYLIDRYISIAYADRDVASAVAPRSRSRWSKDDTRRWLAFVARFRHQFPDELIFSVPRDTTVQCLLAALTALVGTVAVFGANQRSPFGPLVAVVAAVGFALLAYLAVLFPHGPPTGPVPRPPPYGLIYRRTGKLRQLREEFGDPLVLQLTVPATLALPVGLLVTVVASGHLLFPQERDASVSAALAVGAWSWLALAFLFLCRRVFGGIANVVVTESVATYRLGLWDALAADRRRVLALWVLVAAPIAVVFGLVLAPMLPATVAAVAAGCAFVVFAIQLWQGAWRDYTVGHLYFVARGDLPWRLRAFLTEAREHGILYESTQAYGFRHERLRSRLASSEFSR
ncbi:NACHT domain-containing protein [Micromonospora sp. CPCC 205558]|uniref:NACHT domain-containing protein n=1 Tax=Micromonospora sp. CPCC 205558 TaxID=3122403 RepID=UPI002FEEA59C